MAYYTVLEDKSVQEAVVEKYRPIYWKAWNGNNTAQMNHIETEINVCRYKDYNHDDLNMILHNNKSFKRIRSRYE